MKTTPLLLSVLLFFGLVGCKNSATHIQMATPIEVLHTQTQEIPVYHLDGLDYYLNKQDDKVHVINFWATWCGPCVKELPVFEQINHDNKDVEVTLVSLDFEEELQKKLVPFVNKKQLRSEVVVILPENEADMMKEVSPNWESGIPATLLYNKNKRYLIQGAVTHEELEAEIKKFEL